jgi:hypothetical protein
MMSESSADTEKREEAFRMYNACKESLHIIGRIFFFIVNHIFYKIFFFFTGDISIEAITKGNVAAIVPPEKKKPCVMLKREEEKHVVPSQGFRMNSLFDSVFARNKSDNADNLESVANID